MTAIDFLERLPTKVPAEALEGVETQFHFDLSGDGGGQRTVKVRDGALDVTEGLHGEAKCSVQGNADDFVQVVTGQMNPMMAVMTGKIKISNVSEMMRYARMFGLG